MGLVEILLSPVLGPFWGVRFVLNTLRDKVEEESEHEEQRLQEELVALNMRLELGQISESEFTEQEAAIVEKLKAYRGG